MTVLDALKLFLEYEGEYYFYNEPNIRRELEKFIYQNFTPDKIENLTLEEYCIGRRNVNSFCYLIERGKALSQYGSIRGVSSKQYNVWYDKGSGGYVAIVPGKNETTNDINEINEIFKATKDAIAETISSIRDDIHQGDFARYNHASNTLYDNVQSKIAFLYDSEREIPIYSYSHLAEILTELGVNVRKGRLQRRMDLFDYYEKEIHPKFPNVTPYIFMCFIYNEHYGFTNEFLRDTTIEEERAEHTSKSQIEPQFDVKHVIAVKSRTNATKGEVDDDKSSPDSSKSKNPNVSPIPDQIQNEATGKKGEEYVRKYLTDLETNGIIMGFIDNAISGKDRNENCDFEFDYDNRHYYIDAKATSSKAHDDVEFYITAAEYEKLKQHRDNYYIFYVNDVYSNNPTRSIKIVSFDSIEENKKEVAYYVKFKSRDIEQN